MYLVVINTDCANIPTGIWYTEQSAKDNAYQIWKDKNKFHQSLVDACKIGKYGPFMELESISIWEFNYFGNLISANKVCE